jgi:ADP-ribosylglycohydrolase
VTHAHPEGKAGAIAVAVGAATAYQQSVAGSLDAAPLFAQVLARTPEGATRQRIEKAAALPASTPSDRVAGQLGSGQEVSCQDTVPFVIWCAAHTLGDYEAAFWKTVSGLGDRDTTCAMVGGIVALSSRSIPPAWLAAREPLPELGPHEE